MFPIYYRISISPHLDAGWVVVNLFLRGNKDETRIKRLFGEYITSRREDTKSRKLSFRCI